MWQPDSCGYAHLSTLSFIPLMFKVLFMLYLGKMDRMGGMVACEVIRPVCWHLSSLEIIFTLLSCLILSILDLMCHVWLFSQVWDAVGLSLNQRVMPDFSVGFSHLFWKLIIYFHKKTSWQKDGLFLLCKCLVVKPFIINSQRFLKLNLFPNLN